MKLFEWLASRHRHTLPEPTVDNVDERLAEAEQRKRAAYRRAPHVDALVAQLDEQRRRNHLGELTDAIYRKGPKRA